LDYFFDVNVSIDISSKIRVQDIETQVIPEMFYKSIEAGYNKFEYENGSGILEFNTKTNWTTVIKSVFNIFQKIVSYRADGQGLRLLLLAPSDVEYDPTKDVKGDSDIFLIDAVRDGSDFIARTNEGFGHISGSIYSYSSFNVNYSPARILRKWGGEIKASLLHSLTSYLRWQSSDKNSTLVSRLATESENVIDSADILASDLVDTRWINEKYLVKAPLTTAQLNVLNSYPHHLIKLSDTDFGWILNLKTSNKDGMSEFELLKCNLDVVTPLYELYAFIDFDGVEFIDFDDELFIDTMI